MPERESPGSRPALDEEWRLNLIKEGGRSAMYGGDPYEDDIESAAVGLEETAGRLGR